jgi:hypothetical protein
VLDLNIINKNLCNESSKLDTQMERTSNQFTLYRNEGESTKQLIEYQKSEKDIAISTLERKLHELDNL